ncbi:Siroheme synthase [Tepidimonas alkaliphilus]|uniref:uroporphyrinogen-III C-methyltransferase n=1 Tax=Tepidimonas alkaliphilus TaxID=2588942 RepID=A0A554WD84_9BURK|nr:uroporphyrinogen-III C-methyltransferase [Tepidimonas alkaliphilus]TSE21525.1 Siroheme synthase [Tepidimonas alkaliphilus]
MPLEAVEPMAPGWVSIVGAGPGPLDLLTLRALDRLRCAEVVIHDRLIGADILAEIPAQALRYDVGKARGRHTLPQADIHALMVAHARAGRRVVRLKGGDPFIFGRGGEEMQALLAAAVPFEVVPGVSAAQGCGAAAGIPLTQRELASLCVFLPGHADRGDGGYDWAALARPGQTLVFYMGVARLARIAERLMAHGLPPDTPAALVLDGTRPTQTVLARPLQVLASQAPPYGPRPGLVIIGPTVALSPHYRAHATVSLEELAR